MDRNKSSKQTKLYQSGLSGELNHCKSNCYHVNWWFAWFIFWIHCNTCHCGLKRLKEKKRMRRRGEKQINIQTNTYILSGYLFHVQCFTFCHWHVCVRFLLAMLFIKRDTKESWHPSLVLRSVKTRANIDARGQIYLHQVNLHASLSW